MSDTTALIVIASLVVLGLIGGGVFRTRPKRTVLVVLHSGETIRGALLRRRWRQLELGAAELLNEGTATRIDGTVFLHRSNIRWVQRPDA